MFAVRRHSTYIAMEYLISSRTTSTGARISTESSWPLSYSLPPRNSDPGSSSGVVS
jgi:hypothetical protein